jgi:hypothetical protein
MQARTVAVEHRRRLARTIQESRELKPDACSRRGAEARVAERGAGFDALACRHPGVAGALRAASAPRDAFVGPALRATPVEDEQPKSDPSALRAEARPAGAPGRRFRRAAVARRASCRLVTNGDGDERLGATVEGANRARQPDRRGCLLARDADLVNRVDVALQDATATVVSVGARGHGIAGLCRRRPIADGPRSLARDERAAHLAAEVEPPR